MDVFRQPFSEGLGTTLLFRSVPADEDVVEIRVERSGAQGQDLYHWFQADREVKMKYSQS